MLFFFFLQTLTVKIKLNTVGYGWSGLVNSTLNRTMTTQDKKDLDALNLFSKTNHTHPLDLEKDYAVNFEKYLDMNISEKGSGGSVEISNGVREPFEVEVGRQISESSNYNEADLLIRMIEYERIDVYGEKWRRYNARIWNFNNKLTNPKKSILEVTAEANKVNKMNTYIDTMKKYTIYKTRGFGSTFYKNESKVPTGRYLQYLVLFVDDWGRDHGWRMRGMVHENTDCAGAGISFPYCSCPIAFRFHDGLAKWWWRGSDSEAFWRLQEQSWAKDSAGRYLFNYRYPGDFFIGKRLSYKVPKEGGIKIE